MKKAIALSDDGYYIVFLGEDSVGYKKTSLLKVYYISFFTAIIIMLSFGIFRDIYILLLLFIPIITYFSILGIQLKIATPQIHEKLVSIEMKGNILKISTERKTFIIHRGRVLWLRFTE
ncbi:MAG: hypothetical protein QXQ01_05485 [Saccharolobus sp.]